MQRQPLVVLLTDFGTRDPYGAQMKGAILQRIPEANIIDYTHHVRPFNILQAGFFLWSGFTFIPQGSVIICVVDPGVGTQRRIVLIEYKGRIILAPDNGLTGMLLPGDGKGVRAFAVPVKGTLTSQTFHGRDVFAPLAARIMQQESLKSLGEEIPPASLHRLKGFEAGRKGSRIWAHVVHIDTFGNCLLGLPIGAWGPVLEDFFGKKSGKKQERNIIVHPWNKAVIPARTYGELERGQPGLIAGSQGVYELCLREHNLARTWDVGWGDRIELELPSA